jgi:hypothetical protein
MSWGTPAHGTTRLEIHDVEGLRQAYDLAEVYADLVGRPLEVDPWDIQLPLDRPLMVQFLVGHPTLTRVLFTTTG